MLFLWLSKSCCSLTKSANIFRLACPGLCVVPRGFFFLLFCKTNLAGRPHPFLGTSKKIMFQIAAYIRTRRLHSNLIFTKEQSSKKRLGKVAKISEI